MFGAAIGKGPCTATRADWPQTFDGDFERGRSRPARAHRPQRQRGGAPSVLRFTDARRMIDKPFDNAGLVANFVQMAETAADIGAGNLPEQGQHRRIHRISGQERRGGIEKTGSRHHGVGLRLAGRERGAERHIGRARLVAGVDGAQPVGKAKKRLEQKVVLQPRQRIDGVEPMGGERGHDGFRRRQR